MKIKVLLYDEDGLFFRPKNSLGLISSADRELLVKLSHKNRFVLNLWLDTNDYTPVATITIGDLNHSRLLGMEKRYPCSNKICFVQGVVEGSDHHYSFGGGFFQINIQENIIVLSGSSGDLGRFDEDLAKQMKNHLKEVFGVKEVRIEK